MRKFTVLSLFCALMTFAQISYAQMPIWSFPEWEDKKDTTNNDDELGGGGRYGATFARLFGDTEKLSVKVFPNPTNNGVLKIYFTNAMEPSKLRVINRIGQVVHEQDLGGPTEQLGWGLLDVSRLSTGIYFVSLANRNEKAYQRILIQN